MRESEERATLGQRLADRVAVFGGSWTFILAFLAFLAVGSRNEIGLHAANDSEVNLKTELEIRELHDEFDALREDDWEQLVRLQQQIEMLTRLVEKNIGGAAK